jgi:hypothetical protein
MVLMRESPRVRRLRSDQKALETLRLDSTIFDYSIPSGHTERPPELYLLRFVGRGLWRASPDSSVLVRELHEVSVRLGAGYPRMMPELSWKTPVFHPNISASGVVCLGGYGIHWVPSLSLDELCVMLWDIVRYANFDVGSPYNREAAYWAKNQKADAFPVDRRPLRDRVAGLKTPAASIKPPVVTAPPSARSPQIPLAREAEVVEAEIVDDEECDILYIE